MKWKEFVRDYLSFTLRDRVGIMIVLALILGIFFLPAALSSNGPSKPSPADSAWIVSMKNLEQTEATRDQSYLKNYDENNGTYQYDRSGQKYNSSSKGELFYFDPNTLTAEEWKKLGLRDKTIHTIQNYLGKGGKFRQPEDLQRIYGLFPDEFERIAPYINIKSPAARTTYEEDAESPAPANPPVKAYSSRYTVVDINSADTTALIALPGIGSKLAARIINFRDKLGGFYTISQVGETFGLPDSSFQKIKQYLKLENNSVRKININQAGLEELKAHPYIKYSLANPIIAYRNEHGPFQKIEDLRRLMAVTDEVYDRIAPYLSTQ